MKRAESNIELVRIHKSNLGIMKPSHPAYLDVSTEVVSMAEEAAPRRTAIMPLCSR